MKAILLAAGRGTRLRPLTDTTPKCLMPIGGVPLLHIWLDLCQAHGITDVLINTHHLPEAVEACARRSAARVTVSIAFEPVLLGTAGTVRANAGFVAGEPDFFVLYADNLTNADLGELLRFHRRHRPVATLGLYETSEPHLKGIVVCDEEGLVLHYEEKPQAPRSALANAGLMIGTPGLVASLPADAGTPDFGFDVLPRLVGLARARRITGYVRDIGTHDSLAIAQREWPRVIAGAGVS